MNITEIIMTVIGSLIGSSVIASIISYLSTQHSSIRSHQAKYITEERQKWRKDVKEKIALFCSSDQIKELKEIKTFISLSLNPRDEEDKKIIDCMERFLIDRKEEDINELEKRVAFLLKHDWERAKKEVGIPHKNVDRSNFSCDED
ncbi:hypothetical protein NC797_02995 [Aquibacillus sp. 3ASR75-11]|uniref:Uncharacterized protein n=1 Tax=Terrihalobacillus insolitus TaxID=2950438 RepID=A0A9X4AKM4_9BACI|nr:hypothetical protein [Terrihalobacillus insolitus]MDC3423472.1 hypothetical protein [Terrihalobacillus insolitus]